MRRSATPAATAFRPATSTACGEMSVPTPVARGPFGEKRDHDGPRPRAEVEHLRKRRREGRSRRAPPSRGAGRARRASPRTGASRNRGSRECGRRVRGRRGARGPRRATPSGRPLAASISRLRPGRARERPAGPRRAVNSSRVMVVSQHAAVAPPGACARAQPPSQSAHQRVCAPRPRRPAPRSPRRDRRPSPGRACRA